MVCKFHLVLYHYRYFIRILNSFQEASTTCSQRIKQFAEKMMKTPDVRIDSKLNKEIWSQGIKFVFLFLHFLLKIF
jgi:ribosomal protein L31E